MNLSKKKNLLLFVIVFMIGTSGCSASSLEESKTEGSLPERYPNITNTSVQKDESFFEIRDNMIYRNSQPYFRIDSVPEGENTLSVIGESFYVKDDMSLIRIDSETEKVDKLYYDIMDFVAVGTQDIFYINKDSLYQLRGTDDYQVIDSHVRYGVRLIEGNTMYYVKGDVVKKLDLESGKTSDIGQLKGLMTTPETGYIEGANIVIKTVEGEEKFIL